MVVQILTFGVEKTNHTDGFTSGPVENAGKADRQHFLHRFQAASGRLHGVDAVGLNGYAERRFPPLVMNAFESSFRSQFPAFLWYNSGLF
jgi:hypothetical protein